VHCEVACINVTFFVNHPVVKLEILWNSMVAKEGFFYWQKEEAKNELYLLSACYSSRADGGGGVGSQGAWE